MFEEVRVARKKYIKFVKKLVSGISNNSQDVLEFNALNVQPLNLFSCGFLFPKKEIEDLDTDDSEDDKIYTKKSKYQPPSSAGFSLYVLDGDLNIRVFYKGFSYVLDNKDRKDYWLKKNLGLNGNDGEEFVLRNFENRNFPIWDGIAEINVQWRKYQDGYIGSFTLINRQVIEADDDYKERNEKTIFGVELKCFIESGIIENYPRSNFILLDDEQKEIEFRYKDIKTYAIGHGVAVDWNLSAEKKPNQFWIDFTPSIEIPQVTANTNTNSNKVLKFNFLKEAYNLKEEVLNELEVFIGDYKVWVKSQILEAEKQNETFKETAILIANRQEEALIKMNLSLNLLKHDSKALYSFATANLAMLYQWKRISKNKLENKSDDMFEWRPFQLAFILTSLESTLNENSPNRNVLDLIWFPTGGGKTEAYLGLMSTLFLYRRLRFRSSYGGVSCIMRYTLRLLGAQQFLRASKVILALEIIRRSNENHWGIEPFSIGFWVGSDTSPNNFSQAKIKIEKNKLEDLVITKCPWCDSEFTYKNYFATDHSLDIKCHNHGCYFGDNNISLPTYVVDEQLYEVAPSLLVSTVDKFARLAWEEKSTVFFGGKGNRPPEIIIQDELHLISSALGTIVGLYEVGIDVAIQSRGLKTKYIASSATVKNAKEQVQLLFGRDIAIFPPSGLTFDDSYFARTVSLDEKMGRTYIGFLAPLKGKKDSLTPIASALLTAPVALFANNERLLDYWWTQVIYHGSLKSLANSRTLFQNSIKRELNSLLLLNISSSINKYYPESGILNDDFSSIDSILNNAIKNKEIYDYINNRIRDVKNIATLSSNNSPEENKKIFDQLYDSEPNNRLDAVLATNMISVGLDVERLGLMIIDGQPLTTAEYIQASSRVGRGSVPGIVFINYHKSQAKSLSHYEDFKAYHQGFYRYVEPNSVTPFTYQSRKRALHAAIIIAFRHGDISLNKNIDAGKIRKGDNDIERLIIFLKNRVRQAIGDDLKLKEEIDLHIDRLIDQWTEWASDNNSTLVYHSSSDRGLKSLMVNLDQDTMHNKNSWSTLNSMRNVEDEVILYQKGFNDD